MPFAQFHYPFENEELFAERFPADYICEAIDQTRGWFYTQLAESVLLFDQTNFLNCVCLGLILDPEGQKMSKSRGNVVDPWEVIERHGADAFRWYYFTSQQPWAGYRFSVDTVGEAVRQFLLTLWNTYSFWVLYANTEGLGVEQLEAFDLASIGDEAGPAGELDRWALSRLQATVASVREQMDGFDCTSAGREIAAFVDELSNWYVRLGRRRFWDGDLAAFATLRHCLLEATKLLAPFTPFLADAIYANLAGGEDGELGDRPDSVHLADFPKPDEALVDPELEAGMEAVRRTVELGRAARALEGQGAPAAAQGRDRRQLRGAAGDRAPLRAGGVRAEREGARVRRRGVRPRRLPREAELPGPRPALRQGHATGQGRDRVARRGRRLEGARCRRGGRRLRGRQGPHPRPRRHQPRDGAARGLPGGGRGGPCRRLGAGARRRAARRGLGARSSTPSRTPASPRASTSPTGSSCASAATPTCSPPPAPTSPTSSGETLASSVAYEADGAESTTVEGRELLIAVTRSPG